MGDNSDDTRTLSDADLDSLRDIVKDEAEAAVDDALPEDAGETTDSEAKMPGSDEDPAQAAVELASMLEGEEKAVQMDTVADLVAELDGIEAGADEIMAAMNDLMETESEEMDEDDDEMEMSASETSEKRADRANMAKGHGATGGADGTTADASGASGNPLMNRTEAIQGGDN